MLFCFGCCLIIKSGIKTRYTDVDDDSVAVNLIVVFNNGYACLYENSELVFSTLQFLKKWHNDIHSSNLFDRGEEKWDWD